MSSHKKRQAALQTALINAQIEKAYNKGHREGFTRGLAIWMFCTMECTNWKQNGLLKIWQKCQDVAEALEMPETGLIFEDLQLALAAEAGIVSDEISRKRAREALDGNKPTKDYKAVVNEAMAKYEAIIELRKSMEESENERTESESNCTG